MYFNILKKDLKRKKIMNIILFIFIVLCTTFMASSVNNLFTTLNALDYFSKVSNVSDYFFMTPAEDDVKSWIDSCEYAKDYEKNDYLNIPSTDVYSGTKLYQTNGSIYFSELPANYNLVLDENNERITALISGEIAISYYDASLNDLETGDILTVKTNGNELKFTIKYIMKDMVYGSSFMGMTRLLISSEDYEVLYASDNSVIHSGYSVVSDSTTALEKDLNTHGFTVFTSFNENSVRYCYIMDMLVAAILIAVSVILIIISTVILYFAIGFTIREDYKEIGIMKAIGLKNGGIKQLYIIKYSFLAALGALIGVILSIPFGNLMIKNIKNTIAIESSTSNLILNLLCGILVIIIVLIFCYCSTGKINRFTAIQAIRSGSAGERFKAKSIYKINRHTRGFLPFQMALNDILSNIKSYMVLIITFILGTLLVILPLNMSNTLKSDSTISLVGIAVSDIYINNNQFDSYIESGNLDEAMKDINALEELYHENGVDVSLYLEYNYMPAIYSEDPNESIMIYTNQAKNFDAANYSYIDGSAPILKNELAMTEISMKELDVEIGDSINLVLGDNTQSYVITASYQSINNMGKTIRLSPLAETDFKYATSITAIQGNFENRNDIEGQIEKLKEITPDYSIRTTSAFKESTLDSTVSIIDSLISVILLVVLFTNCLITVLFSRMFISKNSGEIALLKSIGFHNRTIQLWQMLRIIIVLIISIVTAVLLSNLLNAPLAGATFGLVGASKVGTVIEPLDIFVKYPLILFIGTGAAALLSILSVKSITFKQLGNVE